MKRARDASDETSDCIDLVSCSGDDDVPNSQRSSQPSAAGASQGRQGGPGSASAGLRQPNKQGTLRSSLQLSLSQPHAPARGAASQTNGSNASQMQAGKGAQQQQQQQQRSDRPAASRRGGTRVSLQATVANDDAADGRPAGEDHALAGGRTSLSPRVLPQPTSALLARLLAPPGAGSIQQRQQHQQQPSTSEHGGDFLDVAGPRVKGGARSSQLPPRDDGKAKASRQPPRKAYGRRKAGADAPQPLLPGQEEDDLDIVQSVGGAGPLLRGSSNTSTFQPVGEAHNGAGTLAAAAAAGGSSGARRGGYSMLPVAGTGPPLLGRGDAKGPQQPLAQSSKKTGNEKSAVLWSDKHAPRDVAELAVHKKKVQEVQAWLEAQLPGSFRPAAIGARRFLLVTGPPGSGKSTTVRLAAAALGYEVVEWTPPAPTLFSEHVYQHGEGYVSKLDHFDEFVSRAKFPALCLTPVVPGQVIPPTSSPAAQPSAHCSALAPSPAVPPATVLPAVPSAVPPAPSRKPKLLLLDDVPHAHDAASRQRLAMALRDLAATVRGPIVLVTTETSGAGSGGGGAWDGGGGGGSGGNAASGRAKGLHKEVLASLTAKDGTCPTISFNAITALNIAKVLLRVAQTEGLPLSGGAAESIAEKSDGDVRSALLTLQMFFGGTAKRDEQEAGVAKKGRVKRGGKAGAAPAFALSATARAAALRAAVKRPIDPSEEACLRAAQRDVALDLFHALGKVLYNKREGSTDGATAGAAVAGGDGDDGDGDGGTQAGPSTAVSPSAPRRNKALSAAALASEASQNQRHKLSGWSFTLTTSTPLPEWLQRAPSKVDPEAVLVRSALQPLIVTSFLHENYLAFVDDDAIDDAAEAAQSFSDAAFLCCYRSPTASGSDMWGEDDAPGSSLAGTMAGCVATRGFMFANRRPAPRSFRPLRGPVTFAVDRARASNMATLSATVSRITAGDGGAGISASALGSSCAQAFATGVLPWLRRLAKSPQYMSIVLPSRWYQVTSGVVTEVSLYRSCSAQGPGEQWRRPGGPGGGTDEAAHRLGGVDSDDNLLLDDSVEDA